MNEMNGSFSPEKPKWVTDSEIRENQMRGHLNAMERVQSIVWGLSAHVRHLVEVAEKQDSFHKGVAAAEVEAFADNVEWLIDTTFENTYGLRQALAAEREKAIAGRTAP